jgi:transcriptional regulator with XRE-family HTH domain
MNDEHDSHDAFSEAFLDIVTGHQPTADLSQEDQALLASLRDWAPGLPEALANLEDEPPLERTSIRHDDPIAQMLGLVEDPAVRLDGRRLANTRKAAGIDIAELASRLQRRGWDTSINDIFSWELGKANPPPATINAISEVLDVPANSVLSSRPAPMSTLEGLFTDSVIADFFDDWARESDLTAQELIYRSKRLFAGAGKRNATTATAETLLAILRQFRSLPGFDGSR